MTETANEVSQDADLVPDVFLPGAPHVAIAGIDVVRSTIVNTSREDERPIHWHVSLIPTGEEETPAMISGDLSIGRDGWFIGATVTALLQFAPDFPDLPDFEDVDAVNDLNRILGPWASHALYDVAALVARQSVSAVATCNVDVPRVTPAAHITRIRRSDAAPDEVGSEPPMA